MGGCELSRRDQVSVLGKAASWVKDKPESREPGSGHSRRAHMGEGLICEVGDKEMKEDRGLGLGLLGIAASLHHGEIQSGEEG